jgi:hypothetical protein
LSLPDESAAGDVPLGYYQLKTSAANGPVMVSRSILEQTARPVRSSRGASPVETLALADLGITQPCLVKLDV